MKPDTGLGEHDLWLVRRHKDFKDFKDSWLVNAGADARGALERTLSAQDVRRAEASTSTASARPNERRGNCGSGTRTIRADALHIHAA